MAHAAMRAVCVLFFATMVSAGILAALASQSTLLFARALFGILASLLEVFRPLAARLHPLALWLVESILLLLQHPKALLKSPLTKKERQNRLGHPGKPVNCPIPNHVHFHQMMCGEGHSLVPLSAVGAAGAEPTATDSAIGILGSEERQLVILTAPSDNGVVMIEPAATESSCGIEFPSLGFPAPEVMQDLGFVVTGSEERQYTGDSLFADSAQELPAPELMQRLGVVDVGSERGEDSSPEASEPDSQLAHPEVTHLQHGLGAVAAAADERKDDVNPMRPDPASDFLTPGLPPSEMVQHLVLMAAGMQEEQHGVKPTPTVACHEQLLPEMLKLQQLGVVTVGGEEVDDMKALVEGSASGILASEAPGHLGVAAPGAGVGLDQVTFKVEGCAPGLPSSTAEVQHLGIEMAGCEHEEGEANISAEDSPFYLPAPVAMGPPVVLAGDGSLGSAPYEEPSAALGLAAAAVAQPAVGVGRPVPTAKTLATALSMDTLPEGEASMAMGALVPDAEKTEAAPLMATALEQVSSAELEEAVSSAERAIPLIAAAGQQPSVEVGAVVALPEGAASADPLGAAPDQEPIAGVALVPAVGVGAVLEEKLAAEELVATAEQTASAVLQATGCREEVAVRCSVADPKETVCPPLAGALRREEMAAEERAATSAKNAVVAFLRGTNCEEDKAREATGVAYHGALFEQDFTVGAPVDSVQEPECGDYEDTILDIDTRERAGCAIPSATVLQGDVAKGSAEDGQTLAARGTVEKPEESVCKAPMLVGDLENPVTDVYGGTFFKGDFAQGRPAPSQGKAGAQTRGAPASGRNASEDDTSKAAVCLTGAVRRMWPLGPRVGAEVAEIEKRVQKSKAGVARAKARFQGAMLRGLKKGTQSLRFVPAKKGP